MKMRLHSKVASSSCTPENADESGAKNKNLVPKAFRTFFDVITFSEGNFSVFLCHHYIKLHDAF